MYNRIKSLNFSHFAIVGLAVLCCTFLSSSVHAVDMSPNVHPIWANANPTCAFYIPSTDVWQNNSFSNNTTNSTYSVSKINCDYPSGLNTVKTYAVYSFRFDNFAYDNSADSGWLASKIQSVSGSADWGVVGQSVSATGATGWQLDLYLYSTVSSNGGTFQIYNPLYANEIMYLKPNERITFIGASYWQVTTDTDLEYNYTDVLNTIMSNTGGTNSRLNNIRDSVNGISSKMDDLKSAQDQANDDANDRYQDEKDTTYDEAQNGSDSMDGAFSIPSITNPLSGWLHYFTGGCSVSIPTLASWIHSPTSTYTSWWCTSSNLSNIRNALTAVLSLSGVLVVFGFAFKWLRTNNGED